jgi:hypothetical protein
MGHATADRPGAAAQHGQEVDHAAMGHGSPTPVAAPAAPGQPGGVPSDHAAMGHAGAAPGHPHLGGAAAAAPAAPVAPGAPAVTLAPDPLDAPATTSVLDAQRSAALAREMSGEGAHGGHGDHGATGTYRHLDAGRGAEAHDAPHDPRPPAVDPDHPRHERREE